MNINNINAVVPVNDSIQPVQSVENKGLKRYEREKNPGDGIVYVGYHANYKNNTYSPPGKNTPGTVELGEILDIYV
ncbi:hypothetical protein ACFLZT_05125 [Thermodesulfobacteriota bacterium]